MKRFPALLAVLILFAGTLFAQNACPTGSYPAPNDTSTGTTLNKLAKFNSSGNAIIMTTSDTNGYAGVAVAGAGTSGTVCLAYSGLWPLIVDATTTINHYIGISSSVNGDGADSGATTFPTSGAVIGRVQTASTGAASVSLVNLFPPELISTSSSGSITINTATCTLSSTCTVYPITVIANAGSTGTAVSTLTKLTGAPSTAVKAATTDTGAIVGITINAGGGTTGNATIQSSGLVNCVFSNATTAGDYVQISSATAGDCADTGAGTYPTSGQVIGRVLSTNGSAGTFGIDLFPPETKGLPATVTGTIANGTAALATGAITSGTCASAVTVTATGTATTDTIIAGFNADPHAVTGYIPSTAGMLTIISYPTSNNVSFLVCNNTSSSITPGSITLNWRVVR